MNCENCPAFLPYGMAQWPPDQDGLRLGCTFDYFSRAGLVTGEWLQYVAESGITAVPAFQALSPRKRLRSIEQLEEALAETRGRPLSDLLSDVAIAELTIDVRVARDT